MTDPTAGKPGTDLTRRPTPPAPHTTEHLDEPPAERAPAARSVDGRPSWVGMREVSATWRGPLPPPQAVAQYNDAAPDGGHRVIQMAEREQAHRHQIEDRIVAANVAREREGQWMAFAVVLCALALGTYLIVHGQSVAGFVAIITALGTPVALFIWGRTRDARALERQRAPDATGRDDGEDEQLSLLPPDERSRGHQSPSDGGTRA